MHTAMPMVVAIVACLREEGATGCRHYSRTAITPCPVHTVSSQELLLLYSTAVVAEPYLPVHTRNPMFPAIVLLQGE